MANHNKILLSANPNGKFVEGILASITPKPGTALMIDATVAQSQGKQTWKLFDAAGSYDGGQPVGPPIILLEDDLRGISPDTAYASGDRVKGYIPEPGDELNLRWADISGTVDLSIGVGLIIQDTTGLFVQTTGSPEMLAAITTEAGEGDNGEQLLNAVWGGY